MSKLEYEKLQWDSSRFGYGVGKVSFSDVDGDWDSLLDQARLDGTKLLYVFVPSSDLKLNELAKNAGGFLTDQKVTYVIDIPEIFDRKDFPFIESYKGKPLTEKLLSLSLEAGKFSRYKVDLNFRGNEFVSLYKEWIENSLKGEIARDVLVCVENSEEIGFITLGEKNGRCNIGLIAVDPTHRRKGIGKKLVCAAFKKAREWGYEKMDVVTQLANENACIFYRQTGFELESVVNIYHFWL